jgi:NAD(P)-dependent dehydrogenase (short-subunit alcohol dehydrogenase family)
MKMTDFSSQTALITGASRGFGAAISEALAAAGTHVIVVARTTGALEELDDRIQALGGTATLVPLDITEEAGIQQLCLNIYERWGGLDLWVHAAIHVAPLSPAAHVSQKDWDKCIDVNIRATGRLVANVEQLLLLKSGTAVHLNDDQAGVKFQAAYGACKAAQKALFDSWAAESTRAKIQVRSFTPAPMPTATRARFFPGEDRSILASPRAQAARLLKDLA